jgi:hypothetical protein
MARRSSRVRCAAGLCPNSDQRAWRKICKDLVHPWDEGKQVGKLVRSRIKNDYCDRQCLEVLLVLKILVDCDEGIELVRGSGEELAVLDTAPPNSTAVRTT